MLEHVKTIRMYSAPFECPYCERAKTLFERFNVPYTEIVGNLPEPWSSYPQIFFDDEHIGGCQELFYLLRKSKFEEE